MALTNDQRAIALKYYLQQVASGRRPLSDDFVAQIVSVIGEAFDAQMTEDLATLAAEVQQDITVADTQKAELQAKLDAVTVV